MKVNKMIYIEYDYLVQMERFVKYLNDNGEKISLSKVIERAWEEMCDDLLERGIDVTK